MGEFCTYHSYQLSHKALDRGNGLSNIKPASCIVLGASILAIIGKMPDQCLRIVLCQSLVLMLFRLHFDLSDLWIESAIFSDRDLAELARSWAKRLDR